MADVFISYKREEIEAARLVSENLQLEGFSTFFDAHDEIGIDIGEPWDIRLERELADARVVVVLWSAASVGSHNVRDEARRAYARGVLVPAKLNPCDAPLGLGTMQTADLSQWKGDRGDANWRTLIDKGVSRLTRPSGDPAAHEQAPSPARLAPAHEPAHEKKFRIESRHVLRPLGPQPIATLQFSTDTSYFAAIARDGATIVLGWADGKPLGRKLSAPFFSIKRFAFTKNGYGAVAADANGKLRRWTSFGLNSSEALNLPAHERAVAVATTKYGARVVTEQKERIVRLYDVGASLAMLCSFSKPNKWSVCLGVDYSGERLLFLHEGKVCIASVLDGELQTTISPEHKPAIHAQFSGAENVAMILSDGSIAYWNRDGGLRDAQLKQADPLVGATTCIAETWGGIVCGSQDRAVRLHSRSWSDLRVETEIRDHDAPVSAIAASGAKIVSASLTGELRCLSLEYD